MLFYPNGNGAVRDRINSVNNVISKDRYFVNYIKCPRMSNALSSQGYDKKTGKPEKSDDHKGGAVDDYNDALGYFLVFKFPIRARMSQIKPTGF